jgi:hypothetical protein
MFIVTKCIWHSLQSQPVLAVQFSGIKYFHIVRQSLMSPFFRTLCIFENETLCPFVLFVHLLFLYCGYIVTFIKLLIISIILLDTPPSSHSWNSFSVYSLFNGITSHSHSLPPATSSNHYSILWPYEFDYSRNLM